MRAPLLKVAALAAAVSMPVACSSGSTDGAPTLPASLLAHDEGLLASRPDAEGVVLDASFAAFGPPAPPAPSVPPDSGVSCPPSCDGGSQPANTLSLGRAPGGEVELVATITPETRVYERTARGIRPVAFAAETVRRGMRARAWFPGGLQESFPARGTASAVLLEEP